jgi:N-carbamoylputrescine amidase
VKIGYVEWPTELAATGEALVSIRQSIEVACLDLLITNELPFGRWVASSPIFSAEVAKETVAEHERGLQLLAA